MKMKSHGFCPTIIRKKPAETRIQITTTDCLSGSKREDVIVNKIPGLIYAYDDKGNLYYQFTEHDLLYRFISHSFLMGVVVQNVDTSKYNLLSLGTGKLRFPLDDEPDSYEKIVINGITRKWHKFMWNDGRIVDRLNDLAALSIYQGPKW